MHTYPTESEPARQLQNRGQPVESRERPAGVCNSAEPTARHMMLPGELHKVLKGEQKVRSRHRHLLLLGAFPPVQGSETFDYLQWRLYYHVLNGFASQGKSKSEIIHRIENISFRH